MLHLSESWTHLKRLSTGTRVKGNKRHHANVAEEEGPSQKRERNDNSDNEYSLISTLIGTVTHGNDT